MFNILCNVLLAERHSLPKNKNKIKALPCSYGVVGESSSVGQLQACLGHPQLHSSWTH